MTKRLRNDTFVDTTEQPISDCLIGSAFSIHRPYEEVGYLAYGDEEYEPTYKNHKRRKRDGAFSPNLQDRVVRTKLEFSADEGGYLAYGDEEYEPTYKTHRRRKRDGGFPPNLQDRVVRTKLELSADDLGTTIAQGRSLIQKLSVTNAMTTNISREMQSLQKYLESIKRGSEFNGYAKLDNLTKRQSLHETNNFIFLQLGFTLSYQNEPSNQHNKGKTWNTGRQCKDGSVPYYYSTSTEKCWETNRATPVLGLLKVLQKMHEYNYLRQYITTTTKTLNQASSTICSEYTLPFLLTNAELEEIASVLERVMGHALTNLNSSLKEEGKMSDESSTEAKVEMESLLELSLLMFESCLGILKSMNSINDWIKIDLSKNKGILETLVRVILDTTRNRVSLFKRGLKQNFETVRSQTILLLKNLTQASTTKDETSTAEYAFLCVEIVMSFDEGNTSGPDKNLQSKASENKTESFRGHNIFEHNQSATDTSDAGRNLICLLKTMCTSLRSRRMTNDLPESEWNAYFDEISSMMKNSAGNDRLLENILLVVHYFAMSHSIAIPMLRHSSLINSIASFATISQNSDIQEKDTRLHIDLRATRCITLLAYQTLTSSKDVTNCINMTALLSKMALMPGGIEKRTELAMSLCLIMKQYPEVFMGVVQNKGREELESFLTRLIEFVEFDQRYGYASYSAKEAATEIIVHVFFNQNNRDWPDSHSSKIGITMKRLLKSRDETSETIYIKLINENHLQDNQIYQIGKECYFLNALAGITCNDCHDMVIKEGAMCILAFLSADKLVSMAMVMNECVTHSLMSYISLRGHNRGINCCHFAIETIISISSFPPNRQILVSTNGMMGYLVKLVRTMSENVGIGSESGISQATSILKARLKQAIKDLVSSM